MKASQILAAGALVAPALAQNRTEIVTITNTAYTTYCPVPTTIPIGNITYTVSKATTLTITNCPCTLTKTGWFKPTPTPFKPTHIPQPECPGGKDCGNNGGNPGSTGGNPGSNPGSSSGSTGSSSGSTGSNGGSTGSNSGSTGSNSGSGSTGSNGGSTGSSSGSTGSSSGSTGSSSGSTGSSSGSTGGSSGSSSGSTGSNSGNSGNNGGSGIQTSTTQGGCDEKTGAGCSAGKTATSAQPTGTSVVVAGANVNGLSAGALVVAGFAAMLL